MTKNLIGLLIIAVSFILIFLLGRPLGSTPALGFFLSPSHGFWRSIDADPKTNYEITLQGPKDEVSIIIDERGVPHIFANTEEDLYYAQGYIVAKDRLWQMDFVSYYASGRLTEIVGEKALEIDQYNRRIGLVEAAKKSEKEVLKNEKTKVAALNFQDGVNAYIDQLKTKDYPIEYKLMGYQPEHWNTFKSALLLKYMANDLTGSDSDIEFSNALQLFGKEIFDQLYPEFPAPIDPIIPLDTKFGFTGIAPQPNIIRDSSLALFLNPFKKLEPEKGLGSNNWAVGSTKTASGLPILCNDPHLALRLPSIWYEMQLVGPGVNVYGVTIPGSPGIIIGYNESMAWGVTNGSMDVRDWYVVENKKGDSTQYLVNNEYKKYDLIEETYKIKGGKDYKETIKWTVVGPVVYDASFAKQADKKGLAMSWLALRGSNELLTFYLLNRSKNHADYLAALDHYWCPAQNFVYADALGNVAIKEQGRFWIRAKEQGKFVQSLATANLEAIDHHFIPNNQNPYVLNPTRGFVSSANQVPVGPDYPYYIHGGYENYRNRRINEVLAAKDSVTSDDMKKLQNDTKSLLASETLPFMLSQIKAPDGGKGLEMYKALKSWDFFTDYKLTAPSYFYKWWEYLEQLAWDEFKRDDISLTLPENYNTSTLLQTKPNFPLFDIVKTKNKIETAADIIQIAFDSTEHYFEDHANEQEFRIYKNTALRHLAMLDPFSRMHMPVGGYINIVNATSSRWGASWRMIVDFKGGKPSGQGVYPGGQSGNPGSAFYASFADNWADGKYYQHQFFKEKGEALKILNKAK